MNGLQKLLDMQKEFNDKSLELNRTYLKLKAKQDQEEIDRQRKELQEQGIILKDSREGTTYEVVK